MVQPYKHEPFTNFTVEENRKSYLEGLKTVEGYLGQDHDLLIGGERISTDDKIVSYNPSNKEEVIGRVSKANRELAEKAMQAALKLSNLEKSKTRNTCRCSFQCSSDYSPP